MAKEEVLLNVDIDTKDAKKSLKQLETEQKKYAKRVSDIETQMFNERNSMLQKQTKEEKEQSQKRLNELQKTKDEFSALSTSAVAEIKKINKESFADSIDNIGDSIAGLGNPLMKAKAGVQALGKGFKALLKHPIVLLIAGLVAGLTAIYKAFTRTSEGANKMNKAFAFLQGLFIPLIKGLEELGGVLFDAFSNPQKAVKELGESIETYIADVLKNVTEGLGLLGSAIMKVFSSDFEGALEDAKKGAEKLFKPLTDVVDGVAESTKKAKEEALSYADANAKLSESEANLVKMQRENEVLLSKQLKDREALMNVRDNELLSIDERIKANEDLNKIETEQLARSKKEKELALAVAIENARLQGETPENLERIKEAEVELNNVIADSLGRQNEYILNRQGLLREQAEYSKAEIDFELEKVNITEKSEEKKLEAKIKALQDTANLYEKDTIEYKEFIKQKELAELELTQFKIDKEAELQEGLLEERKKACEKEGGEWIDGVGCSFVERDKLLAEEKKETAIETAKSEAVSVANGVASALFDATADNLARATEQKMTALDNESQRELDVIQDRLDRGLISQERAEADREKLKAKTEKKIEKIEKDSFEKKKKTDTSQAIMNGALAITQVFASTPPPASFILAGSTAIATGIEVATIRSQKFERGGILKGKSHAEGGIPMTIDGVGGFEAEGGEAVINKRSAMMFRDELSIINQAGGGVKFEKGGILGDGVDNSSQGGLTGLSSKLDELIAVSSLPTRAIVSETEITESQTRISNIEQRSSF